MEFYRNVGGELDQIRSRLVTLISVSLGLNLIVVTALGVNRFNSKTLKYSTIETCNHAMKQLIANNPSKQLFNKSVLKDLKKNKINFSFERIQLIKYLGAFSCDVVVKDHKGFRSYLVSLEKNSKYKYFYKVKDIKGKKITSRYQVATNSSSYSNYGGM